MKRLYKEIQIWQPVDNKTLIRYRCIHVLPDDKYAVKASDYVRDPIDPVTLKQQEEYYLESLFDGGLEMLVNDANDSLEEAINKHKQEFEIAD
jgi:hypothetical protein